MAEMKNICGKIPLELHEQVRAEIERTESSTQLFLQKVIEEHFMKKGAMSMAEARTIAVQVSEELFGRLKAVVAKKHCKQKDFLIEVITQAIEAEEAKWTEQKTPEEMEEPEELEVPVEDAIEEPDEEEPVREETEPEEPETESNTEE